MKNQEIFDISLVINRLIRNKFLILTSCFIFFIVGVFYSLTLNDKYTSTSYLQVNSDEAESNASVFDSLASGFGGFGLSGINVSGNRADYAVAVISSKQFLEHLSNIDGIKKNLIAVKKYDKSKQQVIYDKVIFNESKSVFLDEYTEYDYSLNKVMEFFEKNLLIKKDNKTQFITISFIHDSPYFAKYFLELLLAELNEIIRKKELERSNSAIKYLADLSKNETNSEILSAISQLTETELKKQMLANISKNYLLDPIDAPNKPIKKSGPRRSVICLVFILLGLFLSSLYVIIPALKDHSK